MRITGERIVTRQGGFNASWQRHAACYAVAEQFLPAGPVVDIGCGLGHAFDYLSPRWTVGADTDHLSLSGQRRPVIVADMRRLPFHPHSFGSVVCVHAIEHVPDPLHVVAESARVLAAKGKAVFVTPNRLTFGRPDEIIDPYHYLEFDAHQLRELVGTFFSSVQVFGLFGSDRYMAFYSQERSKLQKLLGLDALRTRRLVPRRVRQVLYDRMLYRARRTAGGVAAEVTVEDFELRPDGLENALDLLAVCE